MIQEMGKRARAASLELARATTEQKNQVLLNLADQLESGAEEILENNAADIQEALAANLSAAMVDRLTLNPSRLSAIAQDLRGVASLPDPVGEHFDETTLPNGLMVHKQRVPLGVIGVIYEARPNVTLDIAGLAVKTGNSVILRGGSETLRSNRGLVSAIQWALQNSGLPKEAVQLITDPDRARVAELLNMHQYVDMLIPRGGAELHKFCRENSRIPVITGGIGICHLYFDESADLEQAVDVIHNAKVQRPTVCNSLDTVLIHKARAASLLPPLISDLRQAGVTFRVDSSVLPYLLPNSQGRNEPVETSLPPDILFASPQDFDTEWLSLVLGIKVVNGLDQAIEHIRSHSTGHSDGILTGDESNAERFVAEVDSAAVYVNASTRFTDGGQLGLGAEVAISTQRLHARGPMGLRELTTYKWVIIGQYHTRK